RDSGRWRDEIGCSHEPRRRAAMDARGSSSTQPGLATGARRAFVAEIAETLAVPRLIDRRLICHWGRGLWDGHDISRSVIRLTPSPGLPHGCPLHASDTGAR